MTALDPNSLAGQRRSAKMRGLKLVIVHNHFRRGGVRRVIELATPEIARLLRRRHPGFEVVLAAGEPPETEWFRAFSESLAPIPVSCRFQERAGYVAGHRWQRRPSVARLESFLAEVADLSSGNPAIFWAHNQGLGRNLALTEALQNLSRRPGAHLLLHHHDWWFDNRWRRWPEMKSNGYSLAEVAKTVFNLSPRARHITINQADFRVLNRRFQQRTVWLPNPSGPGKASTVQVRHARKWLDQKIGKGAPAWLMPVRLLRRKNIAEALLLTRWLRPEAWLLVTGTASSIDEEPYAQRLQNAARREGWQLKLGLLEHETAAPNVPALLGASEVVLLTSLQEGFGLPYLEATRAGRPLLARMLPNMEEDLANFGCRFPQQYQELLVDPALFDAQEELGRQRRLFAEWRQGIPQSQRRWAQPPQFLRSGPLRPVPFSRLTLTAQLEVLLAPMAESWNRCAKLNPSLAKWREAAGRAQLRSSPWPAHADRRLSLTAYAREFCRVVDMTETAGSGGNPRQPTAAGLTQKAFMRERLQTEFLYPLLFSDKS